MAQRKKIPEGSELQIIINEIDNKVISLRKKAKNLNVSPSSLHGAIKKFKEEKKRKGNQVSLFVNEFTKPNSKPNTTQKVKKPNRTLQTEHPKPNSKPNTTQKVKKPNRTLQTEHPKPNKRTYSEKEANKRSGLRKGKLYIPSEFFRNAYWVITKKQTRDNRGKVIDKLIKLLQEQKKMSIKKPRGKQ